MGNSLVFIQPKNKVLEHLKSVLSQLNAEVTATEDVNKGVGVKAFVVTGGVSFSIVVYFNNKAQQSSKLVFENAPQGFQEKFQANIGAGKIEPAKVKKAIPIYVSVDIKSQDTRKQLRAGFDSLGVEVYDDSKKTEHMDYMIKLQDGNNTLTVTQFSTGKLLVQGAYSELVDRVIELIDQHKPLTDVERALLYVPEANQSTIKTAIESKQDIFQTVEKINRVEEDDFIDFLFHNDKKTFFTGEGLIEILKETQKTLPEYNFVVAQFAKVFEGFMIKLMIDKGLLTWDQYKRKPENTPIGETLWKEKFKIFIKDEKRNGYVIQSLKAVWKGSRCKEMHSDPIAEQEIISVPTLEEAIERVGGVKACMKDAYRILVKHGFTAEEVKKSGDTVKAVNTVTSINAFKSVVGIDESGKGDYFGPLVIAGVVVEEADKEKLLKLGVKDSKELADSQIKKIAGEIYKSIGKEKINVVLISPEKYNELYSRMKNLNRLLAWGHARVLENLLSNFNCDGAISDQFGDEQFLKNALMEKGKEIKLIQMPKAEQNVAVAAASIIARNVFVERLENLCGQYQVPISKGVSDLVIKNANQILSKYGKEELKKVVKLHFKTTEQLAAQ